jgi:NADH:ubiquinone oxidoreductase subunit H
MSSVPWQGIRAGITKALELDRPNPSGYSLAECVTARDPFSITVACLASLLFLGGWHGPLFGPPILQAVLPVFWFGLRVFAFLFIYIWVRGTLPRFRYDQLMAFGWKFLLPVAIANLVITALIVALKS